MKHKKVIIIGAGASGLTAAKVLNQAGVEVEILEQSPQVGGRLRTMQDQDMYLDFGFQVVLEAYPEVERHIDFKTIPHTTFVPGAMVCNHGKRSRFGDPRRDFSFIRSALSTDVANLNDKWLMVKLSNELKKTTVETIFESNNQTTLDFLKGYGFSDKVISRFFKPFYTGIFLETELQTHAAMFKFVFKMFSQGNAILPHKGIQEIAKHLQEGTTVSTLQKVLRTTSIAVLLEDGTERTADAILWAGKAENPTKREQWKSVSVYYFTTESKSFGEPILGLIADEVSLSNNFHFMEDVLPDHPKVVSVTVVKKHAVNSSETISTIQSELKKHANIALEECVWHAEVPFALPNFEQMKYQCSVSDCKTTEKGVYVTGDYLSNPSLNAAMANGTVAANAILDYLKN